MKHVLAIAGREMRSYFVSPMAYAVLVLFALLGGFFFVAQVRVFQEIVNYYQQINQTAALANININDHLVFSYYHTVWLILLFLVPGLTMGLFTSEKSQGTMELLMTSPLTIWELVLGKYLAALGMVSLLVLVLALQTATLFIYGDPEWWQTLAGVFGVFAVGASYAAIGLFTSSVTRNPLISFFLCFVMLLVLYLVGQVADIGAATSAVGDWMVDALRWISSDQHFETLTKGLIDTRSLAYFAFIIGVFLVLTKTAVESQRWR